LPAKIEDVDQLSPHDPTEVRLGNGDGFPEKCAAAILLLNGTLEQPDCRSASSRFAHETTGRQLAGTGRMTKSRRSCERARRHLRAPTQLRPKNELGREPIDLLGEGLPESAMHLIATEFRIEVK
jgi:hypothetical protein